MVQVKILNILLQRVADCRYDSIVTCIAILDNTDADVAYKIGIIIDPTNKGVADATGELIVTTVANQAISTAIAPDPVA